MIGIALAKEPNERRRALTWLSAQWVDDLAALKAAEHALTAGAPIDITESALVLARLARGYADRAEGFLHFGVRDDDGRFLGRSLDDALAPVYDRLEDWTLYASVVHARDMHAAGKDSGFTERQIADTIQKFQSPAFDAAIAGVQEFHAAKRHYMVQGGALSARGAAVMGQRYPHYMPAQRAVETIEHVLGGRTLLRATHHGLRNAYRCAPIDR